MFTKVKNVKSNTFVKLISTTKSLFYLLKAFILIFNKLLIFLYIIRYINSLEDFCKIQTHKNPYCYLLLVTKHKRYCRELITIASVRCRLLGGYGCTF